jgi:hypothetical protein
MKALFNLYMKSKLASYRQMSERALTKFRSAAIVLRSFCEAVNARRFCGQFDPQEPNFLEKMKSLLNEQRPRI